MKLHQKIFQPRIPLDILSCNDIKKCVENINALSPLCCTHLGTYLFMCGGNSSSSEQAQDPYDTVL